MTDINQIDSGLIDISARSPGFGGVAATTYSVFHGLNVLGGIPALPANVDHQGFTFFTKPCLNLSYDNVIGQRKMAYLADKRKESMGNLIRCMLSPPGYDKDGDAYRSSIIDDKLAFLPVSNLLLTLSAPPDIVADTYTSNEGFNKEQVTFVDSKPNIYNAYDLTATFANMEGDPISTIFSTWLEYEMRVLEGSMLPYTIHIVENRIDYNTRIYRFTMDRSKRFINRIYACGAAFPTSVPTGAVMGYTQGQHFSSENDQIQITFRCMGAMYDDPILIREFNDTVVTFNPDMHDSRRGGMKKISGVTPDGLQMLSLFNYRMYPRIAPTMELEWYATASDYTAIMGLVNNALIPQSVNTMTELTPQADQKAAPVISPVISPWTNSIVPLPAKPWTKPTTPPKA